MTTWYSEEITLQNAGSIVPQGSYGANVVYYSGRISTTTSMLKSETIHLLKIPKGVKVIGAQMWSDTSQGSAKFGIGIAGATAKYRVSAVFTTPLTTMVEMLTPAPYTPLAAEETILLTNDATANLAAAEMMFVFKCIPAG